MNTSLLQWWRANRQLDLCLFYVGIGLLYVVVGNAFPLWTGASALVGTLLILLRKSRHQLVLLDILPALAILQLWVAPAAWYTIEQYSPPVELFYRMPVAPNVYFGITIPGILALCLGSQAPLFFIKKTDTALIQQLEQYVDRRPWLPWTIMAIGMVGIMLEPVVGPGFRQLCHYLGQLLWVGAVHLLFTSRYKVVNGFLVLATVCYWLREALASTIFGYFIFWLLFGALYWQLRHQWSVPRLLVLSVLGLTLVLTLFTFKYHYRSKLSEVPRETNTWDKVVLFTQTFTERLQAPLQIGSPYGPLLRFNQGYYLGLVYAHVPANQPFVHGETIYSAFVSALVPRLFWPDKPMAGGHVNFPRFTGRALEANTSTNISPIGDAYVNFGPRWAMLFLFLYALTLRLLFEGFRWLARHWYAPVLLWLPLIYMTGVSVERDVLTVWNDAVKGTIFIIGMSGILYFLGRYDAFFNSVRSKKKHVS